ncbi:MAG: DNA polymerase IV [Nitrospira sp.]|nr:DNA polymerase IV [Nitrospira sp.]MCP9473898.1 DNA polymerase IV [Nitrospira sp.]
MTTPLPRWPRQVLFADVDAMFASAAVVKDPSLAGKPIAVGGPPPRGIIAAASYAVRAFGVRSAMPTAKALRLCPDLILIPPDRPLYRRLHETMRAVTDRLFPLTEWSSIDEFYAELTELQSLYPDPTALGRLVKDELFAATGLRCTIAIASGKTVAKIAADRHKPDGLVVVEPGTEASFLAPCPLRALPGVGPKTESKMTRLGLTTIGDLLDTRWEGPLRHLLGDGLTTVRDLARGIDREPVVSDRESKSISRETTFERDTRDRLLLERTLRGFLSVLAHDLRQNGTAAAACAVKLKDSRFAVTTKQRRFSRPLNYEPDMWPTVRQVLHDLIRPGTAYRLAGLSLTDLAPAAPGLFDGRRARAIQAMDTLIARYGSSVIGLGGVSPKE